MQRAPLAQEFRAEHDAVAAELRAQLIGEAHGNGGFDDDMGRIAAGQSLLYDRLDTGGVEIVRLRVVIGGCRHDDEIGIRERGLRIRGRGQIKRVIGKERVDIRVCNGVFARVDHVDAGLVNVQGDHCIVLGKQDRP